MGRDIKDALTGVAVLIFVAALAFLALRFVGCTEAQSPRAQARAATLTVADAVRAVDETCAAVAILKNDVDLAQTCAKGYDEARLSLLAAEEAIDATTDAAAGKFACALAHATSVMRNTLGVVEKAGGKAPPVAEDALTLAAAVTGACHG